MLSISPAKVEELPPLAQEAGGEAVRLDGNAGLVGYAGVVQTSLVGAEYFIWFQLVGAMSRKELLEARRALTVWQEWRGAMLYATFERARPDLLRWAKFMGFTFAGVYDNTRDVYRRK